MDTVAVINYKGGVCKTTLTANLAAGLACQGKKVLVLDFDPQSSLTFSFIAPDEWTEKYEDTKTIKSWFDAIIQGQQPQPLTDYVVTPTRVNNCLRYTGGRLDLVCSHLGLINVDLELATLLGGANMQQAKQRYIKVHGRLREAVLQLADTTDYDIVLIDCPPNFNIVTKNAIVASDNILIPALPDHLSTLGIDYLIRNMNSLVKEYNEYADIDATPERIAPHILGCVFTKVQIYGECPIRSQQQFISQTKRLGVPMFKEYLRNNNTIFAIAPQEGIPVVLNRYSNPTYAGIVKELKSLTCEFLLSLKRG